MLPHGSYVCYPPPPRRHQCFLRRAAQRAFRERKQSQLAELQARVQSYEQGEIERNVALQNIAKRLKEENESLRAENAALKEELDHLKKEREREQRERESLREREVERKNKRWREEDASVYLNPAHTETNSRKRYRTRTSSPVAMSRIPPPLTIMHSPPSLASSPGSNGGSVAPFSPLPFVALPSTATTRSQTVFSSQVPLSVTGPPTTPNSVLFSQTDKPFEGTSGNSTPFDPDCGLCSDESNCVCREFAMHQAQAHVSLSGFTLQDQTNDLKVDLFEFVEHEQDRKPTVISIPPASLITPNNGTNSDTHGAVGETSPIIAPRSPKSQATSILDNLPAFRPAVPLPGRRNATISHTAPQSSNLSNGGSSSMGSLFQIRLPSPEPLRARSPPPTKTARRTNCSSASTTASASVAVCSGDPSNCMACKDDDFGKAFCRALGDSVCSSSPCTTCPQSGTSRPSGCCGGGKCGSAGSCKPNASVDQEGSGNSPTVISLGTADEEVSNSPSTTRNRYRSEQESKTASSSRTNDTMKPMSSTRGETIPTSDAWRQLKSHPNIAFADLSMLADVVARRTKCTGPTAVIHPPPGSLTPERFSSPVAGGSVKSDVIRRVPSGLALDHSQGRDSDNHPVLLTDPHARYHEHQHSRTVGSATSTNGEGASGSGNSSPPPSLVPQEELRQCGRARLREVDAAGVREALRILDAQFGRR